MSTYQWSIRLALPLIHGIRLQWNECGSADDRGTFTARTVNSNQTAERLGAENVAVAWSKTGLGPAPLSEATTRAA